MKDFKKDFADYIASGHAMLSVLTHEKDRAIEEMMQAAGQIEREVHVWNIASGWRDKKGEASVPDAGLPEPDQAIQQIMKLPEKCVCVLKDFGPYVQFQTFPRADVVTGWLDEIKQVLYSTRRTIVFVGPEFQIPVPLRHDVTQIEFDLPDAEQIQRQIRYVCESVECKDGKKFKPNEERLPEIVNSCKGMTQQQVIDRVALAVRKFKDLNEAATKLILHEKAGVIRASGILNYSEPPEGGLAMVGGLDALKTHVLLDLPCFSDEACQFGIEPPKGILLVGIPGCGKTLISIAIASQFGFPLIQMDVGNIMDKFVGESEANMRQAIRTLEAIAPCVLQLDEIEKGFGGAGDLDGGASRRVFGTFIKWLNDRTSPVYVVATANQVQSLPPEFARKGRFDEVFGVDLPTSEERTEIIVIHLKKRRRDPKKFDLGQLVEASKDFTGSDIEQAIKVGLKLAYAEKSELHTGHCLDGIKSIVPLFKTEPQRISDIRDWCKTRAKAANEKSKAAQPGKAGRRVTVSA